MSERDKERNLKLIPEFHPKISKRDDDDALHGEGRKSNLFLINIASTQKSQKLLPAFIYTCDSFNFRWGEG